MNKLLLVAGNGRNVGKTYFACQIIKGLSKETTVIGVKISSHFHAISERSVLAKTNEYIIAEEKEISDKDSSLMLQAGAEKVFFVMAEQKHLLNAFEKLQKLLPDAAIVCESGGLHEIVKPGLFFFINKQGQEIIKEQHLNHSPIVVNNSGTTFDFDSSNIEFTPTGFKLKDE